MISFRKLLVYAMIVGSIIIFAGCSSGSSDSASSSSTPAPQAGEGNNASERPDRTPDLEGKVKQIRGNEVTILKLIRLMPELTEEEKAKRREQMQSLSPEERAKMQAEMFKVTDETKDITIPVGVPIVSNQTAGGKSVAESVSLADIRQGNIIRFWFAEGSSDEIIYVQVMRTGQ